MRLKFSPQQLISNLYDCCKRFPITIAFLAVLSTFLVLYSRNSRDFTDSMAFFVIYYSATGALLSLSLKLWSEEVKNRFLNLGVQAATHAIWLAIAIWLANSIPFNRDISLQIITPTMPVVMILSLWLLPFWKSKNDLPLWRFMVHTIFGATVSALLGLILSLSLCLLFKSFEMLFAVDMEMQTYANIWIVCMTFVAPVIFLQTIPAGEAKHNETVLLPRFQRGVTRYLLLPIIVAYLATLYAYTIKIIIEWQLPNGWVSALVTALMAAMLLFIFSIYPTRHEEGEKFNKKLMRWLPIMVLPLLALMSIGVARRLNDYGITIARLYLVIFNVWCYAVCIGLFLTRSKRFRWVMASFGVVLLLSAIGPWSVSNITKNTILNQVEKSIKKAGFNKLPLDSAQYKALATKIEPVEMKNLDSKLLYLYYRYREGVCRSIIDSTVIPGDYAHMIIDAHTGSNIGIMEDDTEPITIYNQISMLSKINNLPKGYNKFSQINENDIPVTIHDDVMTFKLNLENKVYQFSTSLQQLKHISSVDRAKESMPHLAIESQDSVLLLVDSYSIYADPDIKSIEISGIAFIK